MPGPWEGWEFWDRKDRSLPSNMTRDNATDEWVNISFTALGRKSAGEVTGSVFGHWWRLTGRQIPEQGLRTRKWAPKGWVSRSLGRAAGLTVTVGSVSVVHRVERRMPTKDVD